jgi:hypothetical protein
MSEDIFGGPLERDPRIALPDLSIKPTPVHGPIRKLQFVIEIVGPRTAPAPAVQAILQPHWQHVLGSPQTYVMAAADKHWRQLAPNDGSGAYDSISLAWDLLSPRGNLTPQVAQNLWNAAEDLARQLGRRAIAIPIPQDVPQNAKALTELRESLDIGFNLSVTMVSRPFEEKEIWRTAAALGLDYDPSGVFCWKPHGVEFPFFEVTAGGEHERFLLSQVQSGAVHPALGLGFSVPLCPDPPSAAEGCLRAGAVFAERLKGILLDEEDHPMSDRGRATLKQNLEHALAAFRRAGLEPGSSEALRLFSD